mmetsp:Transcript_23415/g.67212  ORF Transcript_23415/g.67212 Transcript_23415/m.67212 type:complete len:80 (+) Transcript_23415:702-941(+)
MRQQCSIEASSSQPLHDTHTHTHTHAYAHNFHMNYNGRNYNKIPDSNEGQSTCLPTRPSVCPFGHTHAPENRHHQLAGK